MALSWFGLGCTLVAGAFALHPTSASKLAFWAVVALGAVCVGAGCVTLFRNRSRRSLLASECRRVQAALTKIIVEQEGLCPRPSWFGNGQERREEWEAKTALRYEGELKVWAMKVFEQAVKADLVSSASRTLLDARTLFQLITLRELFREIAEDLEG